MIQPLGIGLLLIGAIFYHIAAQGEVSNVQGLWADFMNTINGKTIAAGHAVDPYPQNHTQAN